MFSIQTQLKETEKNVNGFTSQHSAYNQWHYAL